MKKILLVGLTDQEAAAIEIMIGMNWRDAQCTVLRRSLSLAMPEQTPEALACTHCVVDLFGLGMRKYSAENAERLMAFLGGRSAVALAWGADGGGWTRQKLPLAAGQVLDPCLHPAGRSGRSESSCRMKPNNHADPLEATDDIVRRPVGLHYRTNREV